MVLKDGGREATEKILKLLVDKNESVKQWAVEALSFLTLNPPAKELLINNPKALESLITFAKKDKSLWYEID
jgi:hypothetical protein